MEPRSAIRRAGGFNITLVQGVSPVSHAHNLNFDERQPPVHELYEGCD